MARNKPTEDDEDGRPADAAPIALSNIGPVERLELPCPLGGGVVVLRGSNGCGKSEALQTVAALFGDGAAKKDLRPYDGKDAGKAEAFGITLKVGRSNRTSGELEVFSLSDRLDVSALVDPGLKGEAENDQRRIKALLTLTNATADVQNFAELMGPEGMKLIPPDLSENPDVIMQAAGIKSIAEKKAREAEDARDAADNKRRIAKGAAEGVETEGVESNETKLNEAYKLAVAEESRLLAERKAYTESVSRQLDAMEKLEAARAAYQGPSTEQASLDLINATEIRRKAIEEADELREKLEAAKESLNEANRERSKKETALKTAQDHSKVIDGWEATIVAAIPDDPTDQQLADAKATVDGTYAAQTTGQTVRAALAKLSEANLHSASKRSWDAKATQWRDIAHGVDGVLSGMVAKLGVPIKVGEDSNGKMRLMVAHAERGKDVFFSDLSVGEKWIVAIPIAVRSLGKGGVFVLRQEGYEGLDPDNRALLVALCREHQVVCYTAEPSRGELTVNELTDPAVFAESRL
jgi:hypothetical protein